MEICFGRDIGTKYFYFYSIKFQPIDKILFTEIEQIEQSDILWLHYNNT
jgi:hypothetical protein